MFQLVSIRSWCRFGWVGLSGFLIIELLTLPTSLGQRIDSLAYTRLSDALVEMQNSELMRNGTLSFCLKSTQTGKVILGMNHEQSLPSASTLKLVSTATALSVLGGSHTFKTYLEYDGQILRDTLKGNLYLRGTGDPSLGSDRFDGYPEAAALLTRWAEVVRKAGIRYVQGQILADPMYLNGDILADTWIWGDIGNYYGAGVQGLNFNENLYRVTFKAGREVGDPTSVIRMEPALDYLRWVNRVTTGEAGSGDQVYIYTNPLGREVLLTGTVPRGSSAFTVKGAIPNPAYAVAYLLRTALSERSIQVAGEVGVWDKSGSPDRPRTILDVYTSPPLRELSQQTNWWSINLYADTFLKIAAQRLVGKSDFGASAEAVSDFWRKKGADTRGFYIKDGSGLSPTGSLTAHNLTDILAFATRDRSFKDFYESIAVLGQTGTVRNIGRKTRAAGNVRAKSGSIEGTRAYAGYVTTRAGERLSFTMIAHKYVPDRSRLVGLELAQLMVLLGDL
jgi:serine-type D-Ala-D-Ala carboxypeptidase/endopeptidase (penicillin-binding protein 4)